MPIDRRIRRISASLAAVTSFPSSRIVPLVVLGLSGSGKSTLLRCINRLVEPTSGTILLDGKDVTAASEAEIRRIRRSIGMIFQQFNLVKRGTVLMNVLSGRLGYVSGIGPLFYRFPQD